MQKKKLIFSLIGAFVAVVMVVTPALAFPPLPSSYYGQIKVNGQNVSDGTVMRALIGGVEYARFLTVTYKGNSVYSLDIPGDDVSTPAIIEGGKEGDTIVFEIGGIQTNQTEVWHSGTNVNLDQTAIGVVNHPPVATNDTYTTTANTELVVLAKDGVLANDIDADGDPLQAVKVSDPAHGALSLNSDGSFNYLPSSNYLGSDSFTYKAYDGKDYSNIATVNITILAPVPVINNLDPNSIEAGSPGFTLAINGTGFTPASMVNWKGTGLSVTRFISSTKLEADIPSNLLINPESVEITVDNPGPGGGASNGVNFTIQPRVPGIILHPLYLPMVVR